MSRRDFIISQNGRKMDTCDQCKENFPSVESVGLLIGSMHVYRDGEETSFSNEKFVFCSVECALACLEELLDANQWR